MKIISWDRPDIFENMEIVCRILTGKLTFFLTWSSHDNEIQCSLFSEFQVVIFKSWVLNLYHFVAESDKNFEIFVVRNVALEYYAILKSVTAYFHEPFAWICHCLSWWTFFVITLIFHFFLFSFSSVFLDNFYLFHTLLPSDQYRDQYWTNFIGHTEKWLNGKCLLNLEFRVCAWHVMCLRENSSGGSKGTHVILLFTH